MKRSLLEPNSRVRKLPTPSEKADRPSPSLSQKLTSIFVSVVIGSTPPHGTPAPGHRLTDRESGNSISLEKGTAPGQYGPAADRGRAVLPSLERDGAKRDSRSSRPSEGWNVEDADQG